MSKALQGSSPNALIKNAVVKIRSVLKVIVERYRIPIYMGYIKTTDNPADYVSKTNTCPQKLVDSDLLRYGPPIFKRAADPKAQVYLKFDIPGQDGTCNIRKFNFCPLPKNSTAKQQTAVVGQTLHHLTHDVLSYCTLLRSQPTALWTEARNTSKIISNLGYLELQKAATTIEQLLSLTVYRYIKPCIC